MIQRGAVERAFVKGGAIVLSGGKVRAGQLA